MSVRNMPYQPQIQPLTDAWQHLPIAPRRSTLLGISFRPLQAAAFGLDVAPP